MQSSVESEPLKCLLKSLEEDILVKNIILTHDTDARQINSAPLLQAVQDVIFHTTSGLVSRSYFEAMTGDGGYNNVVSSDGVLGTIIYSISSELLCKCYEVRDFHARTMKLFDLLGNFKWEAKVVLVLAAFATSYGEFWLVSQLHPLNPLAVAVAMLRQLPRNLSALGPQFKALSALVKSMVDVTKSIIEFESLRKQHLKLDDKAIITIKSQIYIAAYWVLRSSLTCSSLITDHRYDSKPQNLTSATNAALELSSLVYKMTNIHGRLKKELDVYNLQIENMTHQKLLSLFKEGCTDCTDNQEVFSTLFGLRDDMPLKGGSSQTVVGVAELVNKVVILLISKPDILPPYELLFLVQQTCSSPQLEEKEKSHEIVWVPISYSSWSDMEIEMFTHFSNNLPWYSVRQPWLLGSTIVTYIKQAWNFIDEPLMVVLDHHGTVISTNAMDMIFIWGALAYPFSTLREEKLWQETNWSLQLVIGGIDPLLSMRVEEGRLICLYGSDDLNWIREFTSKIKEIASSGIQLELVYVGTMKPGESICKILAVITRERLSNYLSHHNIQLFWLRLERIKRSKLRLGKTTDDDHILKEVESLMGHDPDDNNKGWALLGEGTSSTTLQLQGRQLVEWLKLLSAWGENMGEVGFLGALRSAVEPSVPAETCSHCSIVPYTKEGSAERTMVFCEKCKFPMQKFIFYECRGTTE